MMEPILKYYDLSPNVTAFSTTRHGGFSKGNYASFNINRYCGDETIALQQNIELLCRKLQIRPHRLFMPHQVHGIKTALIDDVFLNKSSREQTEALEGIDALFTQEHQVCIGVSTADCVPILLCDDNHHAVAAVHAGWRGICQRIVEHVVFEMQQQFGSNASDIKAAIGPSISKGTFEVGQEVYDAFNEAAFPMPEIAEKISGKWHIDLWKANSLSMQKVGLLKDNIIQSEICTYNNIKDFFSARKLTIQSGRIFSGIIIR